MNKYVKSFILRGLIFSGLGPVVCGIVFWILELTGTNPLLNGGQMLLAIITTYIIAFVHAGASIFPTIEKWSRFKQMLIQGLCLYIVYTLGYLLNNWIPLDWVIIGIYTSIFILGFLLIWGIAYISVRKQEKTLNKKLEELKNGNQINV